MPLPVRVAAATLLLVSVACERPAPGSREREVAIRAIPNILSYPRSRITQISAGDEAAEVTLVAPTSAGKVADWYRQFLRLNGWQMLSDERRGDGSVVLYAVKDGRPLWITVRTSERGPGTSYTVVGAVVEADSTP